MSYTQHEIRAGAYYDSVVLMQLQRALASLDGVIDAGVVMATPANCELLASSDLLPPETAAGADDLLIVVKARDEAAGQAALAQVDALLQQRRSQATAGGFRPRSLAGAVKMAPEASWVLISVPGRYAAGVARQALELGRHVFLYSDNVPLADEIALKQLARQKGLLLMGPDCGTAVINGVGLGFANRARRGNIGLVGAAGTGLQAVISTIHHLGGGISQAIGTGGRDLSSAVGGLTALPALDLLARDDATEIISLVSKPPDPEVAARLLGAAQRCGKPVVVCFLGYPATVRQLGNLHFAHNLHDAADLALLLNPAIDYDPAVAQANGAGGHLRALFSGGTLAYEALLMLQGVLHPLYSNVPLRETQRLPDALHSQGHTILDLGEDQFTQGRLHPMLDNDLRLRRLRQEAADPSVGVLALDLVLGEGAHPDPAAELAPAIEALLTAALRDGRSQSVVVHLVGTDADPQAMAGQAERLEAAGATVVYDTASLATTILRQIGPPPPKTFPPVALDALSGGLAAINVGLETFYHSVIGQGGTAVHVDWRPPAGGNEKMMALLAQLKGKA